MIHVDELLRKIRDGDSSSLDELVAFYYPDILRYCGVGLRNSFFFELTDFNFLPLGSISVWTPYIIPVAAAIENVLFLIFAIRSYSRHEAS